jgi:hypothetical protein
MSPHQFDLIYYVLLCAAWAASRVRGCFRRWQQPLLRGPEWFFNVQVQPGFYDGEGAKLLRAYRLRMLSTVAIDIAACAALFGHVLLLSGFLLAMVAFIHVFHVFSVDLAERAARTYAVPEAEQPVASLAISLKPRRLRDYSDRNLEIAMAVSSLVAIAWLVRNYLAAPQHDDLRLVFGMPALLLYTQAGFLFAKQVVVAWRTPVPQIQAEEYLEAREATRKFYLKACDIARAMNTVALLAWPALLNVSPASRMRVAILWLAGWVAISVAVAVWQEIKRKQLLTVTLRAHPVRLPDFMGSNAPSWPLLCYQPSSPMLVLKGTRGYSLNLANRLAYVGAAYLGGLAVLWSVLHVWR